MVSFMKAGCLMLDTGYSIWTPRAAAWWRADEMVDLSETAGPLKVEGGGGEKLAKGRKTRRLVGRSPGRRSKASEAAALLATAAACGIRVEVERDADAGEVLERQ
jgi:hypothetical protein